MSEQLELLFSSLQSGAILALLIVEAGLVLISVYLLFLAGASLFAARRSSDTPARFHRFAIMIPAHNEELLLGALIRSLQRLAYPADMYDIHVVADNCTDTTVEV